MRFCEDGLSLGSSRSRPNHNGTNAEHSSAYIVLGIRGAGKLRSPPRKRAYPETQSAALCAACTTTQPPTAK